MQCASRPWCSPTARSARSRSTTTCSASHWRPGDGPQIFTSLRSLFRNGVQSSWYRHPAGRLPARLFQEIPLVAVFGKNLFASGLLLLAATAAGAQQTTAPACDVGSNAKGNLGKASLAVDLARQ